MVVAPGHPPDQLPSYGLLPHARPATSQTTHGAERRERTRSSRREADEEFAPISYDQCDLWLCKLTARTGFKRAPISVRVFILVLGQAGIGSSKGDERTRILILLTHSSARQTIARPLPPHARVAAAQSLVWCLQRWPVGAPRKGAVRRAQKMGAVKTPRSLAAQLLPCQSPARLWLGCRLRLGWTNRMSPPLDRAWREAHR